MLTIFISLVFCDLYIIGVNMAKKKRTILIQTLVPESIKKRIKATPEYNLHGSVGGALRSILDRVLPKTEEK